MGKQKIEYAIYFENGKPKGVKQAIDIDKIEYGAKYKGNLKCINGCEARVKFTQRNKGNKIKFFSNWNSDGKKHNKGCPFNVEYAGKVGREKLKAYYEKMEENDEKIEASIIGRANRLKNKFKNIKPNNTFKPTEEIEKTGEGSVLVSTDEVGVNENSDIKRGYIQGIDASYLSPADVNRRICVYGEISNVQLEYDDISKEAYGYLNLKNQNYTVSVLMSKVFYTDKDITESDFIKLLDLLKEKINGKSHDSKFIVIAYGTITRKSKIGLNISVINPRHMIINDMKMKNILLSRKINDIDYEII